MKYDLLPCPFCGNRNVEIIRDRSQPFVACQDCKTLGPSAVTTGDIREAVALWNTRRDTEPDTDE